MKMQIKEFAEITGVSVRTLHYYDEIGLLRPADVDRVTGYRFYDDQSLLRMQEILFYRELGFSLKSTASISLLFMGELHFHTAFITSSSLSGKRIISTPPSTSVV